MSENTRNNFTELKHCYRVQVHQILTDKKFISDKSFDSYDEAWEYAKNNTSIFEPCGFCVIKLDEPELKLDINFGDYNFDITRGVSCAK